MASLAEDPQSYYETILNKDLFNTPVDLGDPGQSDEDYPKDGTVGEPQGYDHSEEDDHSEDDDYDLLTRVGVDPGDPDKRNDAPGMRPGAAPTINPQFRKRSVEKSSEQESISGETAVSIMLGVLAATKLHHWCTTSYAEHKALDDFHSSLTDLVDTFVEVYSGKYGRLDASTFGGVAVYGDKTPMELVTAFRDYAAGLARCIPDGDASLLAIRDEIEALANKTIYLLSFEG